MSKLAVLLVGHGGVPRDFPREKLTELVRLEKAREASRTAPSERERELEHELRHWPRTPESDPYSYGLERIAAALGERVAPAPVVSCYNEFCAPSIDTALDQLAADGTDRVRVLSAMITPGGSHSEVDIPAAIAAAQARHPAMKIEYVWPFSVELVADLFVAALAEQ
jgi:sirohydrochlorin cobaltochelatase